MRNAKELLGLAPQFGHATSTGKALRSALGEPSLRLTDAITEPHERGAILVAAVFDAFIQVYDRRTGDLMRLVGARSSRPNSLHPDLVQRLANEAARIAQSMLTMCIRAFDYMPPVDVTFGDFLRAMVTADFELSPDDELGQRAALIEGFRLRGIYPEGVTSLAEESLVWGPADPDLPRMNWDPSDLLSVIVDAASRVSAGSRNRRPTGNFGSSAESEASPSAQQYEAEPTPELPRTYSKLSMQLHAFADANAEKLLLDPSLPIRPLGVHPVFRVAPNGRLVIELIAQVDQRMSDSQDYGGLRPKGGTTLIVGFDGTVKYAVAKPLPGKNLPAMQKERAEARLQKMQRFVGLSDMQDPMTAYMADSEYAQRALLRGRMSTLHFTR